MAKRMTTEEKIEALQKKLARDRQAHFVRATLRVARTSLNNKAYPQCRALLERAITELDALAGLGE